MRPSSLPSLKLPDKAVWIPFWFGKAGRMATDHTNWEFAAFFRNERDRSAPIQKRSISLVHHSLLALGQRVQGGSGRLLLPEGGARATEIELYVDFRQSHSRIVMRSDLVEPRVGSAPHRAISDPLYDAPLLLTQPGKECVAALIPCSVILQFFWASSRLKKLLLNGGFAEPGKTVFVPERTRYDGVGHVDLCLRQKMSDRDAPYIATLYTDPSAMHIAKQVALRLASFGHRGPVPLEVESPFAELMTLTCRADWMESVIPGLGQGAYYVRQILSTDYVPRWDHMVWTRENDGTKGAFDREDELKKPMDRGGRRLSSGPEIDTVPDSPPAADASDRDAELLLSQEQRFPGIMRQLREKLEKEHAEFENATTTLRGGGTREGSALEGTPTEPNDAGPIELIDPSEQLPPAAHDVPLPPDDDSEGYDPQLRAFDAEIRALGATVVLNGEVFNLDVDYLDPYLRSEYKAFTRFAVRLPSSEGRFPWIYRDKAQTIGKKGVCVRLTLRTQAAQQITRYLLEFERGLDGKQSSYLGLWQQTGSAKSRSDFEEEDIALVIRALVRKGNPAFGDRPGVGIVTRRFTHSNTGVAGLIARLFVATDPFDDSSRRGEPDSAVADVAQ